ncbi:hypothetical protein BDZ89DRAFT_1049575 [Hymenopellis radicata]|nr:hypothetical protein BDZ89DRAFT_1049575 [Hymenopellis radicata]
MSLHPKVLERQKKTSRTAAERRSPVVRPQKPFAYLSQGDRVREEDFYPSTGAYSGLCVSPSTVAPFLSPKFPNVQYWLDWVMVKAYNAMSAADKLDRKELVPGDDEPPDFQYFGYLYFEQSCCAYSFTDEQATRFAKSPLRLLEQHVAGKCPGILSQAVTLLTQTGARPVDQFDSPLHWLDYYLAKAVVLVHPELEVSQLSAGHASPKLKDTGKGNNTSEDIDVNMEAPDFNEEEGDAVQSALPSPVLRSPSLRVTSPAPDSPSPPKPELSEPSKPLTMGLYEWFARDRSMETDSPDTRDAKVGTDDLPRELPEEQIERLEEHNVALLQANADLLQENTRLARENMALTSQLLKVQREQSLLVGTAFHAQRDTTHQAADAQRDFLKQVTEALKELAKQALANQQTCLDHFKRDVRSSEVTKKELLQEVQTTMSSMMDVGTVELRDYMETLEEVFGKIFPSDWQRDFPDPVSEAEVENDLTKGIDEDVDVELEGSDTGNDFGKNEYSEESEVEDSTDSTRSSDSVDEEDSQTDELEYEDC